MSASVDTKLHNVHTYVVIFNKCAEYYNKVLKTQNYVSIFFQVQKIPIGSYKFILR